MEAGLVTMLRAASSGAVALEPNEVALLQACVGFHAKAQTDPSLRDRLYRLWCKLEDLKLPS